MALWPPPSNDPDVRPLVRLVRKGLDDPGRAPEGGQKIVEGRGVEHNGALGRVVIVEGRRAPCSSQRAARSAQAASSRRSDPDIRRPFP